jgi:hypothetical protein
MQLRWTEEAANDLERIADYLLLHAPDRAQELIVRTTVISPGAVATELPESSTDSEAAEQMRTFYDAVAIPADSFARAVAFAMSRPDDVDVNEPRSPPFERRDLNMKRRRMYSSGARKQHSHTGRT